MFSESRESSTRTAHACMSKRRLEIQPHTRQKPLQNPTQWLSSIHKQAQTKAPRDITAFVCVIIKWVWQVVFLPAALAASVPHSDSLAEFLRELMGRSGRGSRTSAVWDLTEPIRLTSGQDRGRRKGCGLDEGLSFQIQDTSWPVCLWSDDKVRLRSQNEEAVQWLLCFSKTKRQIWGVSHA